MLIILISNNSHKLYYSQELILSDSLIIYKNEYISEEGSKKSNGFIGFFDWLRLDSESIVGVRACFFEHQNYNSELKLFPYTQSTFGGRCIEMMFHGDQYDFDISGDQDFGNNFVYVGKTGDYLFTFSMDKLTDNEKSSVIRYSEELNDLTFSKG